MATQEYIDDLIIVIETAEDAESVTNQMVAALPYKCLINCLSEFWPPTCLQQLSRVR